MTNIAQQYAKLISELYNTKINPLAPEQEQGLEQKLGIYEWADVKQSIQKYFIKNNKTAPNLTQILAIIETNPKIHIKTIEIDETQKYTPLPTTNLWSITQTFDKLVQILVESGIIPDTHGKYNNAKGLIDPKTDQPITNPKQWIKWQTETAIKQRPDLFAKFPNTTYIEALAIAIQNGLVKIKIRDWKKAAEQLKPEEKTWIKSQTRIGQPATMAQIIA